MKTFKGAGLVVVTAEGALKGRKGTIARKRMGDDGAWVNIIGDPIPDDIRSFPKDDEAGRGNHVLLYPEDCEKA